MNTAAAHDVVVALLAQIAPEVDLALVPEDADLREAVDLDSLDFLTLVERVAERTGVDIPEDDYADVRTLAGLSAYVAHRTT